MNDHTDDPDTEYQRFSAAFTDNDLEAARRAADAHIDAQASQHWEESINGDSRRLVTTPRAAEGEATVTEAWRRFEGIDIADLDKYADQEPDWIVTNLFTSDEPLLFGARSKCCKTLTMIELAVALASGTPFMGAFEVPKKRKVLFITGEANTRRSAKHFRLACSVRGISPGDMRGWLRVEAVKFPVLPSPADRNDIARLVKEYEFDVVMLDPLYRGLTGIDTHRLNEVGPGIKEFEFAVRPANPAISHHVIKSTAKELGEPPQLEDMNGAGIAESFGQWWLVGRNKKYAWDGKHDLCVSYGGREGQAGGKRILFDERTWTWDVTSLHDYRAEQAEQTETEMRQRKAESEAKSIEMAKKQIETVCRAFRNPVSKTQICNASTGKNNSFGKAFHQLVQEQTLVIRPYIDTMNRAQSEGYILRDYAEEYDRKQPQSQSTGSKPSGSKKPRKRTPKKP